MTSRKPQEQSPKQPRRASAQTRTEPRRSNRTEPRQASRAESTAERLIPPRLLPWPSENGNPCYLVSNADGGYLSRLADDMEVEQLETGAEVLGHARKLLNDPTSPYTEIRYAGIRLAECLSDVLRIAESRGMRLPSPDLEPDAPQPAGPGSTARTRKTGQAGSAGASGGTGRPRGDA